MLLAHLQVDSAVPSTKFPVMLAPQPQPSSATANATPVCLEVSVTHNRRWHSLVYLEYVGASVRPLRLQLEQNTCARLLRLAHSIAKAQSKADQALVQLQGQTPGVGPTAVRRLSSVSRAAAGIGVRGMGGDVGGDVGGDMSSGVGGGVSGGSIDVGSVVSGGMGSSSGGGGGANVASSGSEASVFPAERVAAAGASTADYVVRHVRTEQTSTLPATFLKFYIQELDLHQLTILLTVQMDLVCDESSLQIFHPTNSLVGIARYLLSLQNVSLTLDRLLLEEMHDTGDAIINRIVRTYAVQVTLQLYKLIRSLDLLGNPAAIFADAAGGLRHFFHEQRKGLVVKSPRAFARSLGSLAGGVVGGTGALAFGAGSGFAGMISYAAATATYDSKYAFQRRAMLQEPARSVRQGLYVGGQLLREGVVSGVAGIVRQPLKGAREQGARGFAKGIGKGTIGLPRMIFSGVSAALSKAAEGAASDTKRATTSSKPYGETTLRVRQPRELTRHPALGGGGSYGAVLLPYPKGLAIN